MNAHHSYPSTFDGMNWSTMPPPSSYVGGIPFIPPPPAPPGLQQQFEEYNYQQQLHQQMPTPPHYRPSSYPFAPPHAPHLAQRNYQSHQLFYPPPFFVDYSSAALYPLPSPPLGLPFYLQTPAVAGLPGAIYPAPPGLPASQMYPSPYDPAQQPQQQSNHHGYQTPPYYFSQEQQNHYALFGTDGLPPAQQQAYQIGFGVDSLSLNSSREPSLSKSRSRGRGCWTEADLIAASQNQNSGSWRSESVSEREWPNEKRGRSLTGSQSQQQQLAPLQHPERIAVQSEYSHSERRFRPLTHVPTTRVAATFPSANNQEHDHPSFDRPPHRGNSIGSISLSQHPSRTNLVQPPVQQPTPASSSTLAPAKRPSNDVAWSATSNQHAGEDSVFDLISNESSVPPPPSIEFSAVSLSDLATEMVWEACALAVVATSVNSTEGGPIPVSALERWTVLFKNKSPSASFSPYSSARSQERRSSSPGTPELFGAIGEGRSQRKKGNNGRTDSIYSSPSISSEPRTPEGDSPDGRGDARRVERLAGLGCGVGFGVDFRMENSVKPVEVVRHHARQLNPSTSTKPVPAVTTAAVGTPVFPLEPSTAFRQFVKQVLTATLLAPEDLLLALYFVAKIPSVSFIQQRGCSTPAARANAVKAAPFKVILGALMLANKTLQDNSYRNETFAAVSGIPLKDVNELEIVLFTALKFDVGTSDIVWSTWVRMVLERHKTTSVYNFDGEKSLARLVVTAKESEGVKTCPPTPVHTSSPTGSPPSVFLDLVPEPEVVDLEEDDRSEGSDAFGEEQEGPLRSDQRGDWSDSSRMRYSLAGLVGKGVISGWGAGAGGAASRREAATTMKTISSSSNSSLAKFHSIKSSGPILVAV